jgi:hypothetical protein
LARKTPKIVERPAPSAATPALADRIRWDWIAAGIAMLLLAWMLTDGEWNFFPPGGFLETFYDAQAVSLLHGRIDVTPESIGTESFERNGKAYGYFGPTPALMRLPLELVMPGMYGRWNCLSMLAASALVIGMLMLLMRTLELRFPPSSGPRTRRLFTAALLLAAAIGSTNFFVSAQRKVYQEAILWGSALAFAQAVLLVRYLTEPRSKWLTFSCMAAFLAFFARVSSGGGSLFSLLLVDVALLIPVARVRAFFLDSAVPRRAAVTISATLAVSAVVWAGLNYWKFGTPFTSLPMATNKQFDQQRAQRIKGDLASLYNLPITIPAYLSPSNVDFSHGFPWVLAVEGDPSVAARNPKAHFDEFENFVSLPAAMPELFLAAIAGTLLCLLRRQELRDFRAPLAGTLAGCGLIFVWGVVTLRYLHDLLPWLLLGTAIAAAWVLSFPIAWQRRALAGAFAASMLYAMWANFALGLLEQRYLAYPIPPERRVAFIDLSDTIDTSGLKGLARLASQWRRYIPATSFQQGNLVIDRTELAERGDAPVVRSQGQSPNYAEYLVNLPSDGAYEIGVRYASGQSLPVHLLVNRQDVKQMCDAPTRSWHDHQWDSAGPFKLRRGPNLIGVASNGTVPPISMLRVSRAD